MHPIQKIIDEANNNQWSYPQTFAALKQAGVMSYTVDFANNKGWGATYITDTEIFNAPTPEGYIATTASTNFDTDNIKKSIINRAENKTTYVQFLSEIARAGVSHYFVDMSQDLVTYYNADESKSYQQQVPKFPA